MTFFGILQLTDLPEPFSQVAEDDVTIEVGVARTGGTSGQVLVEYFTADGSEKNRHPGGGLARRPLVERRQKVASDLQVGCYWCYDGTRSYEQSDENTSKGSIVTPRPSLRI